MRFVYLVQHAYLYGRDNEHEEAKIIGIFDSEEKANEIIQIYKDLFLTFFYINCSLDSIQGIYMNIISFL